MGKIQGVRVSSSSGAGANWTDASLAAGGTEVWAKQLADGKSVAVVLLNLDDTAQKATAEWADIVLAAGTKVSVRDLWAKATLPNAMGSLTATVSAHGTRMFKLTVTKLLCIV